MLNKIKSFLPLIILFSLGLIPLLWFKPGYIATGHDMGYSLNPLARIISRIYVWPESFNLGFDTSIFIGSIPLYIPEAMLQLLGFSAITGQKIVFMFWFVLPGISMYILLRTVSKFINISEGYKISFYIIGSIFYSLNHYLLHSWFIATKPEISFMITTPILLSFLVKVFLGKGRPFLLGIISAFLLTFFNAGGGIATPLYGGLFIVFIWFFIFFIFLKFTKVFSFHFKQGLKYLATLVFSLFFLNAYWLLPFIFYVKNNYISQLSGEGGTGGILNWVWEVSKYATFSNIMRLQGFSSWYNFDNHPFSNVYIENPIFILISFVFLMLFFVSLHISKKSDTKVKIIIGYFFGLGIITIFFMGGTRSPLGFLYEAFIKYIPGFNIFRSPFYKFGYSLWVSYAVLISFSLTIIIQKLSKINFVKSKKEILLKYLLTAFCVFVLFIYSYPFFNGVFFNWNPPLSTMVRPPSYIFDFQTWIEKQNLEGKVLIYPPLGSYNADVYSWNYWSLTPFPNLLSEKYFISNKFSLNPDIEALMNHLYNAIELKDEERIRKISNLLNIKYILFRRDFESNASWMSIRPINDYEEIIYQSSWLKPYKHFGEWSLYKLSFEKSNFNAVEGGERFLEINQQRYAGEIIENISEKNVLYTQSKINFDSPNLLSGYIIGASCINCHLRDLPGILSNIYSRILPSSLFYKYVLFKENLRLTRAKTNEEKAIILSEYAVKRFIELENMKNENINENTISKILETIKELLDKIYYLRLYPADSKEINSLYSTFIKSSIETMRFKTKFLNQKIELKLLSDEKLVEEIQKKLDELEKQNDKLRWETTEEDSLKYVISVPASTKYAIYAKNKDLLHEENIFQEDFLSASKIIFEDEEIGIETSIQKYAENKYYYEPLFLKKGIYRATLKVPPYKNYISNLSQVEVLPQDGSFSIPIPNVKVNQSYLFTFYYDPKSSHRMSINILGVSDNGSKIEIQYSTIDKDYSNRQRVFFAIPESTPAIRKIEIKIKNNYSEFGQPYILINKLSFHPLVSPNIFLDSQQEELVNKKDGYADVEYQKINPTYYLLNISNINNPFPLLFKEGYNSQWKIYVLGNDKISYNCKGLMCQVHQIQSAIQGEELKEIYHIRAQGFANAWYIDPQVINSKKSLAIIFLPQIITYFSILISLISVVIFSFILVIQLIFFSKRGRIKNE